MTQNGWTWIAVLAVFAAIALGALTWFAIAALIEIRATARELRESLKRLTPLAEDTLRQTRSLTQTAAEEVAGFAQWRHSGFASVASGLGAVLGLVRAFIAPKPPRNEPERDEPKRDDAKRIDE
jgi:hypothetical protein